jgi:hypothetical protein
MVLSDKYCPLEVHVAGRQCNALICCVGVGAMWRQGWPYAYVQLPLTMTVGLRCTGRAGSASQQQGHVVGAITRALWVWNCECMHFLYMYHCNEAVGLLARIAVLVSK